jgi:hypothetical protein
VIAAVELLGSSSRTVAGAGAAVLLLLGLLLGARRLCEVAAAQAQLPPCLPYEEPITPCTPASACTREVGLADWGSSSSSTAVRLHAQALQSCGEQPVS